MPQVKAKALRGGAAALDALLASVEGVSRATEPTEMRIAAVQALQASSLLQPSAAAKGELPSWIPILGIVSTL